MTNKDYSFGIGAKDTTREAFESIDKRLQNTGRNMDRFNKQSKGAMSNISKNAGQASIQLQQLFGQIQIGVNPMTALSQQAADLGFVLGAPLIGSIIGIGAGIGAFLLPSLFKSKNATRDLIEEIKKLSETQLLTADQSQFLASQENLSITAKQKTIKEIEKQIALNEKNLELMTQAGTGLDKGQYAVPRSQDQNRQRYAKSIKETNLDLLEQKANLQLLNTEIEKSREKINAYVETSKGINTQTENQKNSVTSLISALTEENDLIGKSGLEIALYRAKKENATEAQLNSIRKTYSEIEAKKLLIEADKEAQQQALKAQQQSEREAISRQNKTNSIVQSLQAQIIALEQGAEAARAFNIAQQLGLETIEQLPENIQNLINKLNELSESQSEGGFFERLRADVEKLTTDFDAMWGRTFDRFAAGIGDATASAIAEGKNFSETMKTFARSAVQEVISGIIQIGIKKTVLAGIESALRTKSTAETVAATGTIAATTASAMAPAAAATSLATAGGNATPAISGMGIALAAALSMLAIQSFEGGGYTGHGARVGGLDGKGGRLAMVHPQEIVTDLTKSQGTSNSLNSNQQITVNFPEISDSDFVNKWNRNRNRIISDIRVALSRPY